MNNLPESITNFRFYYAAPAFVLALPAIPVWILLPAFYGETLGLGLALTGGILLVLRLLDMISDPLIGWLSDHWQGPGGRRKGPITVGALIAAPAFLALFSPPQGLEPVLLAAWLAGWGFLLYLGWTAIQIPWLAWAGELAPKWHQRSQLHAFREGLGLAGFLTIGIFITATDSLDQATRYQWIAILALAIGLPAFWMMLVKVPDRANPSKTRLSLSFPGNNRIFLRLLTAWLFNGLANALPAVCLPLFVAHILQASDFELGLALLLYFLTAIIAMPLWIALSRKLGKHRVWCISMALACSIFAFVPFLQQGDILAFLLICLGTGTALGCDLALPPSMQSDCADYDHWRFRKERSGQLFSWWSLVNKLAPGIAVGLALPVLEFQGLTDGNAPDSAIASLIFFYAILPIMLKFIAIAIMWRFPLGQKRHDILRLRLQRSIIKGNPENDSSSMSSADSEAAAGNRMQQYGR